MILRRLAKEQKQKAQARQAELRLAFMGSPDFAVPALRALHAAGHEIAAVYSQPPRPAGRGQALRAARCTRAAERWACRCARRPGCGATRGARGLRGARPRRGGGRRLRADPAAAMLDAPRAAASTSMPACCRAGAAPAPIQAAVLAGDAETGVTIMQMEAGLDTGPMLLRGAVPIGPRDDRPSCTTRWRRSARALVAGGAGRAARAGAAARDGVTYAAKLRREDGRSTGAGRRRARPPGAGAAPVARRLRPCWAASAEGAGGRAAAGGTARPATCWTTAAGRLRRRRAAAAAGAAARPRPMEADAFLRGRPVPRGTSRRGVTRAGRCCWNMTARRSSAGSARRPGCRCRRCWRRRRPAGRRAAGRQRRRRPHRCRRARGRPGGACWRCRTARADGDPAARRAELPHAAAPGGGAAGRPVPDGWHARFSAVGRRYRYRILNRARAPRAATGPGLAREAAAGRGGDAGRRRPAAGPARLHLVPRRRLPGEEPAAHAGPAGA